jgi:hypothetical protein
VLSWLSTSDSIKICSSSFSFTSTVTKYSLVLSNCFFSLIYSSTWLLTKTSSMYCSSIIWNIVFLKSSRWIFFLYYFSNNINKGANFSIFWISSASVSLSVLIWFSSSWID